MGFYIGKIFVAYYGLMIVIGIVLAILAALPLIKKYNININDFFIVLGILGLSALLGSKLLYLLIDYHNFIVILDKRDLILLNNYFQSGFVFYGGFIFIIISLVIFDKCFKTNYFKMIKKIFPVFILTHSIGRVGCHLVGCCYGKLYNGVFAVMYHNSLIAPNDVKLFPTQIVESIVQFLAFIFFYTRSLCNDKDDTSDILLYILIYACYRFLIEFERGDVERGVIMELSISQYISLAFVIGIILVYIVKDININRIK